MTQEGDDPWAEYPLNSPSYEPSRYNGVEIRQQLRNPPTECFSTKENDAGISLRFVDLFESQNDDQVYTEWRCRTEKQVEESLVPPSKQWPEGAQKPRVRIISIHSEKTVEPLQITAPLMQKLLWHYDVAPEFVPIMFAFGDNANMSESGNSNLYVQSGPGDSKKLSYEIRYMEHNGRKVKNPWSERHTGVYHHHEKDFDLFVLLQSVEKNTAEQRLRSMANTQPGIKDLREICKNPFRLHVLIASSYMLNWRWHLRNMTREFNDMNDLAMVLSPGGRGPESLTYERVQSLRNVQDKVIATKASCKGDLQVLNGLARLEGSGMEELYGLPFQVKQLEGFIDSADVLRSQIRNTIELIDYSLNRQVQVETMRVYGELSKHSAQVADLTKDNNKNNTTVTVVTLVSAFYLPGSFAATLYGMNFFLFDQENNSIAVAQDFWIFILTWIPLMALTFGLYFVVRRNEDRPIRWLWKRAGPMSKSDVLEMHAYS